MIDKSEIGIRIRNSRKGKGWSQEELGAQTGFSQPKVSKIERYGTDSLQDVSAIADALDISVVELVVEDEALLKIIEKIEECLPSNV